MIEVQENNTNIPTPKDARMQALHQSDVPETTQSAETNENQPDLDTILAFGSAKNDTEVTIQDITESREWLFNKVSGEGKDEDDARFVLALEIVKDTFPEDKRPKDERTRERYDQTHDAYLKALVGPDFYFETRKKAWIERNRPASPRPDEPDFAMEEPLSDEVEPSTAPEQLASADDDEYYTAYEAGGYEGDLESLLAWKEQAQSVEHTEKHENVTETTEVNLGAVALTASATQPETSHNQEVDTITTEAKAVAEQSNPKPETEQPSTPNSNETSSEFEKIKFPTIEELARRDGIAADKISANDRATYEDILRISKGVAMLKTAKEGSLLLDKPITVTKKATRFDKAKEKVSGGFKKFKNFFVTSSNKLGLSPKMRATATYLKDTTGRIKIRTSKTINTVKQADVKGKLEGFLESTNASMERGVKKMNKFVKPKPSSKDNSHKDFDNHGGE